MRSCRTLSIPLFTLVSLVFACPAAAGETGAPGALLPATGAARSAPAAQAPAPPAKRPPAGPRGAATTTTTSAAMDAQPGAAPPPPEPDAPAEPAHANAATGPVDGRPAFTPLLGIASESQGVGLGVRGGLTFPFHLYFGGSAVYQLPVNGVVTNARAGNSSLYLGPETGFDFVVDKVITIRPYLGLGVGMFFVSSEVNGVRASATNTQAVLWPGCTVFADIPNTTFFAGGDARLLTVPSGASFGAFALFGMRVGL